MKKSNLLKVGLICSSLSFGTFLTACSKDIYPVLPSFQIDLISSKTAFSNSNLPSDSGAKYTVSIGGDIGYDDYALISLDRQVKNGIEGFYLQPTHESTYIKLNKGTNVYPFYLEAMSKEDTSFYQVFFYVNLQIYRSGTPIYKQTLQRLTFCNGTPMVDSMFITEPVEDGIKLVSINPDPAMQEQMKLCNTLVIPSDITEIAEDAFAVDKTSNVSSIPDSISYIFLDSHELELSDKSNLQIIGDHAFPGANFSLGFHLPSSLTTIGGKAFINAKIPSTFTIPSSLTQIGNEAFFNVDGLSNISFPITLTHLGDSAFLNCHQLSYVDLSNFDSAESKPSEWGDNLFSSLSAASEKFIIYNQSFTQTEWENFFVEHGTDVSDWTFKPSDALKLL